MVKGTSKAVYGSLKAGKLGEKQNAVVQSMSLGGRYTRREIASVLHEEASSIAGRVNELIDSGYIRVFGTKACSITGKRVECLCLTTMGYNYKVGLTWSPNAGHGSMARASSTRSTQAGTAQEIRP